MMRKGQAAVEFLMTYGWAIILVIVVISALAYFGVLNPQKIFPARCVLATGLACRDFTATATGNQIKLSLRNGLGKTINVSSATANSTSGDIPDCRYSGTGTVIKNGDEQIVSLTCVDPLVSDITRKHRWDLGITWYYTDSSVDFAKTYPGELFTTVEP